MQHLNVIKILKMVQKMRTGLSDQSRIEALESIAKCAMNVHNIDKLIISSIINKTSKSKIRILKQAKKSATVMLAKMITT